MDEDLIKYVMDDKEVKASAVTSYQIATVLAVISEFINNQPERLNSLARKRDAIV